MRPTGWEIHLDAVSSRVLSSGLEPEHLDPARERTSAESAPWSAQDAVFRRHRLQGLLVHAVATGHLSATSEQRREVAMLELDLTRNRVWHDLRLIEITELLDSAGVDHRVLKGPAFGSLEYPDRIMRPTGDIDLLVRGEQLDDAIGTLTGRGGSVVDPEPVEGYTRTIGKSTTVTMPDGLEIDLHRTLVRGPFGVRMRPEDLWERSRSFAVGGVEMTTIGREESLLHSCYHLMILSDERALSVRDVAQFLADPALDVDRTIALATAWRAEIVVASAVLLAGTLIPTVAGSPLIDWARGLRAGPIDRFHLRIARPGATMGPAEWPATFMALRSNRDRRMLIRSILRPIEGTSAPFLTRVRGLLRRRARALRRSVQQRSNSLVGRRNPGPRDQPHKIGDR